MLSYEHMSHCAYMTVLNFYSEPLKNLPIMHIFIKHQKLYEQICYPIVTTKFYLFHEIFSGFNFVILYSHSNILEQDLNHNLQLQLIGSLMWAFNTKNTFSNWWCYLSQLTLYIATWFIRCFNYEIILFLLYLVQKMAPPYSDDHQHYLPS